MAIKRMYDQEGNYLDPTMGNEYMVGGVPYDWEALAGGVIQPGRYAPAAGLTATRGELEPLFQRTTAYKSGAQGTPAMSFDQWLSGGFAPWVANGQGDYSFTPEAKTQANPEYTGNGQWGDLMQGLKVAGLAFGGMGALEGLLGGAGLGASEIGAGGAMDMGVGLNEVAQGFGVGSGAGSSGLQTVADLVGDGGGDELLDFVDTPGGGFDMLEGGLDYTSPSFTPPAGGFDMLDAPLNYTSPAGVGAPPGMVTSALNKIFGSNLTDNDTKLIGDLIKGGVGMYAGSQKAGAISDEGARLDAMQAPWRQRLSDMYANPAGFLTSAPVAASIDQGTQAVGRALSTKYGNPAIAPNALAEINKYASNSLYDKFGTEANRLAAFGGLNFPATSVSNLNVGAANATDGTYEALGDTIGNIFSPKKTMSAADLIKMLSAGNLFSSTVAA